MGRPHIEFLQVQNLPWEKDDRFPGIKAKNLSIDQQKGDFTALHRFPVGMHLIEGTLLGANEEFYVLSGLFHLNGMEYTPGCYGFFPAHYPRNDLLVMEESIVLRMFDGDPENKDEKTISQLIKHRPVIPYLDTYRMQWDTRLHDIKLAHLGLARKNLRIDPVTGQRTFLFMTAPQTHPSNWRGPTEAHPTPEESFLISGDLTGQAGTMTQGAYFWRPPHIPHGPFGSIAGSMSLIRFVGGKHLNIWSDKEQFFSYRQAYNPELPPNLLPYAGERKSNASY